ncbi:hypothetical protein ABPG74_022367 [Tetrahymena malaccensis]
MSLTQKQQIYTEVIKKVLEAIHKDANKQEDILKLINDRLSYQTIKIQYDSDFYTSLAQYFQKIHYYNTKDKEDVFSNLLFQCKSQNLILQNQYEILLKQIIILKRLRRIHQSINEDPKRTLDTLKEEYDQEGSCEQEQLLQEFEKDKKDLKMQIEDDFKNLTQEKIQQLLQRYCNQQQKNIKNEEDLESILVGVYKQQKIDEKIQQRLLQEVEFIRQIISNMRLKELFGLEYVTVQPYGSIVSGFAQQSSDIDVSINTNCYIDEEKFILLLHNFIQSNYKNKNIKTEIIASKHTPLLKYTKTDKLDQKQSKIEIDICINNILGCVNSLMLKTLSELHPKIQQLGIIIKHWAKQRGVSSKTNLSSYAFILMMFCFLFRKKLLNSFFVLDKQQNQKKNQNWEVKIKRKRQDAPQIFQTNLYFCSDVDDLKQRLAVRQKQKGQPSFDEIPLSQLFTEFIEYYYSSQNDTDRRFISIFNFDKLISCNQYKYQHYDDDNYFNIEDPFDVEHNPGIKTNKKRDIYEQAFQEAKSYIDNKQYNLLFTNKNKN